MEKYEQKALECENFGTDLCELYKPMEGYCSCCDNCTNYKTRED